MLFVLGLVGAVIAVVVVGAIIAAFTVMAWLIGAALIVLFLLGTFVANQTGSDWWGIATFVGGGVLLLVLLAAWGSRARENST